jgi:hypothetical protein
MKILVHSPSDAIAGGCESIHQLCDALSENFETYITYYHNSNSEIPKKFQIYNLTKSDYFDDFDTIHIFPETSVKYFYNKIEKGIKVIFWLSVDNYLGLKDYNLLFKVIRFFKTLKNNRISLNKLNNCHHLSQSEYSNLFLKKNKIIHYFIGDYINDNYINLNVDHVYKENIIVYNPRKGFNFTKKIINKSKFKFIPIKNMNNTEVIELMKKSKIYIDFGKFPGRDRIPREAVMLDNVIIIGKRGSGYNDVDFPINKNFKISVNKRAFVENVIEIIEYALNNYSSLITEFKTFKDQLINEKKYFKIRVKNSLKDLITKI